MANARLIAIAVAAVLVVAISVSAYLAFFSWQSTTNNPPNNPPINPPDNPPDEPQPLQCKESGGAGAALCIERQVTNVIDGDTLDIEGGMRIRLVLVDAPELSEASGQASKNHLSSICSGKLALIDEDDYQVGDDPYGRILALVTCAGTNANGAMISSGHADTYYTFCSASEFGSESWTGCSSPPPPPPPPPPNCDPSYPDVCIPPPPPDLNCADITYRNFRVLPPDPHNFDGDGDGIGCET